MLVNGQTNLSQGLMAHYPFSGNAGDSSGNNNHGLVSNATLTADRFGNANSAYLFNGTTSFIKVPFSSTLQTLNFGLTLCAWVKINNYTGSPNKEAIILEKANGNSGDWAMTYQDNDPNPSIEDLRFNGYAFYNNTYALKGSHTTTIPDTGRWYFLTITFDATANGTSEYYIDCNLEAGGGNGGNGWSFWTNNSDLYIGKAALTNNKYFNGIIDDVRIYNRKLTQCEVLKLYGVPKAGKPSDKSVTEGGTTHFEIIPQPTCNFVGYQWQADTGTGFHDIVFGGNYTMLKDTLTIKSVPKNFNNNKYRCIIKGINPYSGSPGCYLDTTGYANLTVIPTSIENVNARYVTKVYPNPVADMLTIESNTPLNEIVLCDIFGRVLITQKSAKSTLEINISFLPKGIYLLKVGSNYFEKIVKQ